MTISARHRLFARIMRRYPFYSGCGTLANWIVANWLPKGSNADEWARLRNGLWAHVPLYDFNGRAIYFAGDVDRKLSWICSRIVRPGDTALDVGANLGLVALTLAQLAGSTGRVLAYEPNPRLTGHLKSSIDRNKLNNLHVRNCALGSENTKLTLTIPKGHSGRGSLVRSGLSDRNLQIPVQVFRLDDILPQSVSRIRLMKIDVEGFEHEVLKGASGIFSRCPPDTVIFEVNEPGISVGEAPAVTFLQQRGYAFLAIPKTLRPPRLRRFDPRRERLTGHDLLAFRTGDTGDEVLRSLRV